MRPELRWGICGALAAAGAAVIVAAVVLLTGAYDVSALSKHWGVTKWLLGAARARSIAVRADILPPPWLKDPQRLPQAMEHFHPMCRLCHGAPGYKPTEFARGLYPEPPDLTEPDVQGKGPSELFWVVKNGLKMTAMPAFGPTHSDEEVWGLVAFVRALPKLSPKEYARLAQKAESGHSQDGKAGESGHGHSEAASGAGR